jgi:UDP-N-acetylglucosamine 2-epimerase (non-hydrolysing)
VKILNVVGARPNFMKMAPIVEAMARVPRIQSLLVHTGQHYDEGMSEVFFRDLEMPKPDITLGVGSGTHAEQTARIMVEFEKVRLGVKPDLVIVVGDVNSTMACTLVAAKLRISVAHVEAGLRSFDRSMPEEINRIVTDALAETLFTTSRDANENLIHEGIDPARIHFVGNTMIDTLLKHRNNAAALRTAERFSLRRGNYALVTLHRPSNVDDPAVLRGILDALQELLERLPVILPLHPRTQRRIQEFGFAGVLGPVVRTCDPLGYLDFLNLMSGAALVLTDSGGLQEETTILGVPCLTLRKNTERPVTIHEGTNVLVGPDKGRILEAAGEVTSGRFEKKGPPEFWDGRVAERIVQVLLDSRN